MATITPFPTPDQRQVLRELDAVFDTHGVPADLRQKARAKYLENISQGRSTAVSAGAMRGVAHQRQQSNRGPSAA